MDIGFIVDKGKIDIQSAWQPGTPEDATIFGMKVGGGAATYDDRKDVPISAFRCNECGQLKLFAIPES